MEMQECKNASADNEDDRSLDGIYGSDTIIETGPADFTEFLTENPCLITSNKLTKKKLLMAPDDKLCCRNDGVKWKNEKKLLPPDEQRCSQTDGSKWRCKNFRMGYGDDDTVYKSRLCEKHFNYYAKYNAMYYQNHLKKRTGDGEAAGCSATGPIECRGLKRRRKKVPGEDEEEQGDGEEEEEAVYAAAIDNGAANVGTKKKKNKEMEKLPPDEKRCGRTGFRGWRCKNFRMGHGAADDDDSVPKSRLCEKHHNLRAKFYQNYLKKRSEDGEAAGCSATGPIKCRGLKRMRKNVTEEDNYLSLDVAGSMQSATNDDTSVTILEGGTGNIKRKRKNVERAEDDRFLDDTFGESEGSDSYVDSENSVGDLMDMLGMENWDWNNDEMTWKSEADMLSSFEEDPVLFYL